MSKDIHPHSPVLIRFQQDLKLKGLSSRTQQSYVRAIRKFSEYLNREPESATEEDVRNYLLDLAPSLIHLESWSAWATTVHRCTPPCHPIQADDNPEALSLR